MSPSIVTLPDKSWFYPAFTKSWHSEHPRSGYINNLDGEKRPRKENRRRLLVIKSFEKIYKDCSLFNIVQLRCCLHAGVGFYLYITATYKPHSWRLHKVRLLHSVWGDSWFSNRTAVQTVYTDNVNVSASCFQNWHHCLWARMVQSVGV